MFTLRYYSFWNGSFQVTLDYKTNILLVSWIYIYIQETNKAFVLMRVKLFFFNLYIFFSFYLFIV